MIFIFIFMIYVMDTYNYPSFRKWHKMLLKHYLALTEFDKIVKGKKKARVDSFLLQLLPSVMKGLRFMVLRNDDANPNTNGILHVVWLLVFSTVSGINIKISCFTIREKSLY